MENKIVGTISIFFLLLIYALDIISVIFHQQGNLFFFETGNLTYISLALFMSVAFLAIGSTRLYFFFLLFVLLAFPSPVDDIFPSVPLSSPSDRKQVLFPLITRIDIFLILGILKGLVNRGFRLEQIRFDLNIKLLLVVFPLVILLNLLFSNDLMDVNLVLAYSFQYRYLVLFLVLFSLYDISKFAKPLLYGLIFSLCFLFLEASLNTYMSGSNRFISGSLSLNTFANVAAAIGIYFLYLLKQGYIGRQLGWVVVLLSLLIVFKTGTRSAVLLYLLTYVAMYLYRAPKKIVLNTLKISFALFVIIGIYLFASYSNYLPERYSFNKIAQKVNINLSGDGLSEKIKVGMSKETNSLKTRIELFETSLNMAKENPVIGIGPGRWNRYKDEYKSKGDFPNVLLDSHNDYLALISQYGYLFGLFFSYMIFLYPLRQSKRLFIQNNPLALLFVINLAMGFAAISNAGFFKHQVSAILLFSLCITIMFKDYEGKQA